MNSLQAVTRRAAWTAFLLFAAVLLVVAPAEASRTTADARPGLSSVSSEALLSPSLERPALGLATPALESSRFSLGGDLGVFDTTNSTNGPGSLGLCGLEARRCAITYARNNPLKYVDPDGKSAVLPLSVLAGGAGTVALGAPVLFVGSAFVAADVLRGQHSFVLNGIADLIVNGLRAEQADGKDEPGSGSDEGAEVNPTLRPDVTISGGKSGQKVKDATGPADSVVKGNPTRGGGDRAYQTDSQGRPIKDITKDRVKPVTPGQGFGDKRAPTKQELDWLNRLFRKILD